MKSVQRICPQISEIGNVERLVDLVSQEGRTRVKGYFSKHTVQCSFLRTDLLQMKGYCSILTDHWKCSKNLKRNWTTASSKRMLCAES